MRDQGNFFKSRAAILQGEKPGQGQYKNVACIQAYYFSYAARDRSIIQDPHRMVPLLLACLLAGYLWYFTFCVIIVIDHYSSVSIKNLLIVALRGFYVFYFQWIQYWVVIRGVWMLFYSERATTNRDNVRILKLLYHIMYCFFLTL